MFLTSKLSTSHAFAVVWNSDVLDSSAETRWQEGGMLGQCNPNVGGPDNSGCLGAVGPGGL